MPEHDTGPPIDSALEPMLRKLEYWHKLDVADQTVRKLREESSGQLGLPDWIKGSDDEDAMRKARALKQHARKCEVWERNRLVAQLDARSLPT